MTVKFLPISLRLRVLYLDCLGVFLSNYRTVEHAAQYWDPGGRRERELRSETDSEIAIKFSYWDVRAVFQSDVW